MVLYSRHVYRLHPGRPSVTWDGRYRLERTLGEGGMGRVLLARDHAQGDRVVALKILLPEYRHSTSGFLREFVTQRRLRHPNIPQVFELGYTEHPRGGEVPYFTLEYCRGVPLIMAIPRVKSLDTIWPWMIQVLRALDYIHSQGWLHRDMKPGNILVDMKSDSERSTRLIDLGVASRIGAPPEKVFIGTPEYCAPEMLSGRAFDQRADLYAFGLVLYEAIAHKRPWSGSSEVELLTARLKTAPPPLDHTGCPEGVWNLLVDLLRPSPGNRPETAAEVIERLSEALDRPFVIEPPAAFQRRLEGQPFPGREHILEVGGSCLSGIKPGTQLEGGQPRVLVVEASRGFDDAWLVQELGDQAAAQGARIIRSQLDAPCTEPLEALGPALTILRRIRQAAGEDIEGFKGAAGAASMLTRLRRPTVVVIGGLQRADIASLSVLRATFTGSRTPNLRLFATTDPHEEPTARDAYETFCEEDGVHRARLEGLNLQQSAAWLESVLGTGTLDVPLIGRLHTEAGGTPLGLTSATHALFEQGVILRVRNGYAVKGELAAPARTVETADVGDMEAMVACLSQALPKEVITAYLGPYGTKVPALLGDGTLVAEMGDLLRVADEAWRSGIYRSLPALQKMRLHRALARAIHEAEGFPDQRSAVAHELLHSDRPVLAAPHLVVAASEAVGVESAAKAWEFLDRAAELLAGHAEDAAGVDTWRWWVMLWKARVRLAMTEGDVDALDEATAVLVELGTDSAHIPTLQFALETRMVSAQERGDWGSLQDHAIARLSLDGPQPGPDARGLHLWAVGLKLRASGEVEDAVASLEEGLLLGPERPRPAVWLRLAAALADILTDLCQVARARESLTAYRMAAEQAQDEAQMLRARILEAPLLRHAGRPSQALEILREVAGEMPPEHVRTASCLLERELSRVHLEFGWIASGRDHIAHARELAERDHDVVAQTDTWLLEANASRLAGQWREAKTCIDKAVEVLGDHGNWSMAAEARLLSLQVQVESDPDPVHAVEALARAEALAEEAGALGDAPRQARALALAARCAMIGRERARAVDLAEAGLTRAEECRGWKAMTPQMLYVVALARRKARRHRTALALETRALEQLRQLAAGIEDKAQQRSWLTVPERAEILKLAEPITGM